MPAQRMGEIVAGKRAATAGTDLRLCRFFGLSNGYWLRAQAAHDTEVVEEAPPESRAKIKPWREQAPHSNDHPAWLALKGALGQGAVLALRLS